MRRAWPPASSTPATFVCSNKGNLNARRRVVNQAIKHFLFTTTITKNLFSTITSLSNLAADA
tara:strand:- start:1185 stop:1370 length:186 start_codon:yes stop_codon:yes gene_type:complete